MEHDEDGIGGGGDDGNHVILASECEVCGSKEFLSEAGFYYCKLCNTQSQHTQQYIDEDVAPDRLANLRQVSTLSKEKAPNVRYNLDGKRIWLSSWEIHNMVIEGMTRVLVDLGFPQRLRDKTLQIWSAYLLRRQVIFTKPAKKPCATVLEARMNLYSLYGMEKPKFIAPKRTRKKQKAPVEDALLSHSQAKKKKTMARKKAFESEYLTHASQMSEWDMNYDNVQGTSQGGDPGSLAPPDTEASNGTTNTASRKPAIRYTKAAKILRRIIKPRVPKAALGHHYPKGKEPLELLVASQLSMVEKFDLKLILILLFVSARQIGCHVVLSDMFRLFNDGTLYVDSLKNIVEANADDEEEDFDMFHKYRGEGTWFVRAKCGLILTPAIVEEVDIFLEYVGIKQFIYPKYEEFLPKFIDDFVLPREFESLMVELNGMFPMEETLEDAGHKSEKRKCLIELWTLATMFTGMKMLFGLDDATEKYQSKFAKTVNKVMARRLSSSKVTYDERFYSKKGWSKLFVLEDWFKYLRFRENLIGREMFGKECYVPQRMPNTRRIHDVIQTYGNYKTIIDGDYRKACERMNTKFEALCEKAGTKIDKELPSYTTMPLPKQSISEKYKDSYPNVSYPGLKGNILNWNFGNTRIDYIWNPRKYIPLLNAAGYTVKVLYGDALQRKLKQKKKELIVFQPYKRFDEFTPTNPSAAAKFIIRMCLNLITGKYEFGDTNPNYQTFFLGILNLVARIFAKRARSGEVVPLKEPTLFTIKKGEASVLS